MPLWAQDAMQHTQDLLRKAASTDPLTGLNNRRPFATTLQRETARHRRTGTLWEGRFRSCLMESERYVLTCYRYVELNPVRAGLVEQLRRREHDSDRHCRGVDHVGDHGPVHAPDPTGRRTPRRRGR